MDRISRRGKAPAVAAESNDQALSSVLADNQHVDSLVLKDFNTRHQLNFPLGSIEHGTLRVGDIYDQATKVLDIPVGMELQLSYNSTKLEDHSRPCRDYHVKNKSVLECTWVPDGYVGEKSDSYPNPLRHSELQHRPSRTSMLSNISNDSINTEPLFVKPHWMRPNPIFIGRELELSELHKLLMGKKRRADGSSAVLLQSLPGGGKTHLAREYVYRHLDEYPGGVFFIQAKSLAELSASFWEIARVAKLPLSESKDPQHFIKEVRSWFNTRHNWLLVLDGIRFSDVKNLSQFIPDNKATSIIYTSTENFIATKYHVMNPQVIKLPLLSAREAQNLLLTELDIKKPTANDRKNLTELVQWMGFLPVAIHTTAQRLRATGEPLAICAKNYRNAPKRTNLNTFSTVVDQLTSLGAIEALNLIKIICFFSQHIPVEMITLGISSVDVPVKASDPLTGSSLDNTIKTLNRFALLDRNGSMNGLQLSSVKEVNFTGEIDMIRMHSAVQIFFIDSCRAKHQTSVWLHHAVALFCQSFSIALQRINGTTIGGLVENFRMYEIHGQKLFNHLQRLAKEHTSSGWQSTLERILDTIKFEIDKRTTSFSKMDAIRGSVFDRTTSATSPGPPSPIEQAAQSMNDSDLESLVSIKDDIFSTAGSFSTDSTVSSTRFTVIELIVGKFIEDKELSTLYEEAIKRMPNERFVRNQRRLLKKFFLDLQPHTKTPIQEQAIRILRGRRERTSIAEQIWSIINPSNVSRHAQMAALLTQKPDKQSQLDRLLGAHGNNAVVEVVYNEPGALSEDSEGSDSEVSGFADKETKYPNIDITTEFLLGGAPFKQYKLNLRGFLRLDTSPAKLHELVVTGDVVAVTEILSTRFDEVAQLEFDWLHELLDIGCSFDEMARLLVDGEQASPWVVLDHRVPIKSLPSIDFHQAHCVHTGGQKLDMAPRVVNATSPNTETIATINNCDIQEIVGELCGIAGAIPLSSDEYEYEWISSVRFTGENTAAWIAYASEDSPATPTICDPVRRMLDALQRAYHAFGYLQKTGICCNTFTVLVLRARQPYNDVPFVELCHIDVSLVESLNSTLKLWRKHATDAEPQQRAPDDCFSIQARMNASSKGQTSKIAEKFLRICGSIANTIIAKVSDTYSANPDQSNPTTWLNECALAVQILTVGILSYAQGHTGSLHPKFLVDPLKEVHLLGNDAHPPGTYIMANLIQLTCIGDMLRKPVLVFRTVDVGSPFFVDDERKYDLFASPEDITDTWSPARFVVDTTTTAGLAPTYNSRNLWAIEVGGGTITRINSNSPKLHWSEGSRTRFGATFDSKDKILIGGVIVNDKCPLNEIESWRHPATNAYLRHLGTRQGGWELQEKQVGLQGGQYAVLAFNATYVKQNGVTLKQQQLMLPSNEIDLAFLNSTCGLQVSFCTGVARRVTLRELLADVMVEFVESKVSKPAHWEELKSPHSIVQNFRVGDLGQWFDGLTTEQRESAIYIVRSMLEVLKDTGIDKNDEELVIAWVRRESPYSCLRLRCEKTSLWARILADSEDCATFACITPLCLEIKRHQCRGLTVAPWYNVSSLLDTAVCPQLSNRELVSVLNTLAPFKLEHQVSYWIGKSGSNLIAKVWLTNDPEPRLVVRQNAIPEKYRSRLPKAIAERLGRLREQQISNGSASQVVILAEKPH